jgi:ketosteroid isomerase-like protein
MRLLSIVWVLCFSGSAAAAEPPDLRAQVMQAENAFAKTLADRDHAAFTRMLAEEAVFFGREGAQRGAVEVAAGWKPLFEAAQPPFSWRAETVEVLASGTLALSSGPVLDAAGKQIGAFNSIWRREPDGTWRVVFDKGCPVCEPK